MEVIRFNTEDIIITSGATPGRTLIANSAYTTSGSELVQGGIGKTYNGKNVESDSGKLYFFYASSEGNPDSVRTKSDIFQNINYAWFNELSNTWLTGDLPYDREFLPPDLGSFLDTYSTN